MTDTTPEHFELWLGDTHCQAPNGLTMKPTNDRQTWLLSCYSALFYKVSSLVTRYEMVMRCGGDHTDRPGKAARDDAIALLRPFANLAQAVYGVPGTPYHAGPDGEEDRTIYDELGARAPNRQKQVFHMEVCGRRVIWGHHAIKIGGLPWTRADGLYRTAKAANLEMGEAGYPVPDLVLGHHVHKVPLDAERQPIVGAYGKTRAAVVPCFSLPDDYHAKRVVFSPPTIGALLWWPRRNELEYVTYPIPLDVLHG